MRLRADRRLVKRIPSREHVEAKGQSTRRSRDRHLDSTFWNHLKINCAHAEIRRQSHCRCCTRGSICMNDELETNIKTVSTSNSVKEEESETPAEKKTPASVSLVKNKRLVTKAENVWSEAVKCFWQVFLHQNLGCVRPSLRSYPTWSLALKASSTLLLSLRPDESSCSISEETSVHTHLKAHIMCPFTSSGQVCACVQICLLARSLAQRKY